MESHSTNPDLNYAKPRVWSASRMVGNHRAKIASGLEDGALATLSSKWTERSDVQNYLQTVIFDLWNGDIHTGLLLAAIVWLEAAEW
jgi:hypothetical protein